MYKFTPWNFIKTGVMVFALTVASSSNADVLCPPTPTLNVMVKSNGDIIFHDWKGKKHLAFKANSDMPAYLAEVIMRGLVKSMMIDKNNDIWVQASYPDGYNCSADDTTTAPLRILFNQTEMRYF